MTSSIWNSCPMCSLLNDAHQNSLADMGRKQKKGSKGKSSGVQHKEAFQRINYLFQVSVYYSVACSKVISASIMNLASNIVLILKICAHSHMQAAIAALSVTPSQPQLSRFYIHTMKTISKRLVLKL